MQSVWFFFSCWYAWVQFPNIFAHDVLCTALSVMPDMIFDTHAAKLSVLLNPDLFAIQDQRMICLILPGRCVVNDFGQFLYTMLENQRGRLSHSTKRQHRHWHVEVCWVLLLVTSPGPNGSYSYATRGAQPTAHIRWSFLILSMIFDPGGPDHHIQNSYVDNVDIDSLLIDDIIWMLGIMKLTLSNAPAQVESFWTVSLPQYQWQAIIDNVNIVNAIDNDNDNTKNNRERCNRST